MTVVSERTYVRPPRVKLTAEEIGKIGHFIAAAGLAPESIYAKVA